MALKITVIGTGYLGATHAAAMAELGFEVLGLDVVPEKIEMLQRGEVPMYEPGLEDLLRKHVAGIEGSTGRLRFTMDFAEVGAFGDVHFVCVNTPQRHGEYACDMSYVDSAIASLAPHLTGPALVRSGEVPMYEPGLEDLLRKHVAGIEGSTGRLRFTMDFAEVGAFGDVHFVCVNTPQRHGEYACDMSYVDSAIASLAPHLTGPALV